MGKCVVYLVFSFSMNQLINNENRMACFCGNKYGSYGLASSSLQCNMNCTGNSNETCGGILRNQIYRTFNGDLIFLLDINIFKCIIC